MATQFKVYTVEIVPIILQMIEDRRTDYNHQHKEEKHQIRPPVYCGDSHRVYFCMLTQQWTPNAETHALSPHLSSTEILLMKRR